MRPHVTEPPSSADAASTAGIIRSAGGAPLSASLSIQALPEFRPGQVQPALHRADGDSQHLGVS
ncbi:hypothetical protein GCM10012289_38300 [Nonomuraea cavernae]|uniref:Uncharacterized protein n=1 Tax=Nonomuraea cavernae TaxID=2045107 RepID=A0A917Z3B9_9ACTN|nr:hypothetical protein GCM10012289_38300 [Nonomuraea cavernae]